MRYPELLKKGGTIGICAPSDGVPGEVLSRRLDNAIKNIKAQGYGVLETAGVRGGQKCVSANSARRAAEFMELYENPAVGAIIPPWGGEFLMDMLPLLDFEKIASLPAKWVCGYSDITTLTFPLTLACDMASVHGSNVMNMGYSRIHETDLRAFDVMSCRETLQESSEAYGGFSSWTDLTGEVYRLDKPSRWKSLRDGAEVSFGGRMLGGCMDTICKLIGTRFAPVGAFLDKYRHDGFVWTLESCEMSAADIYRTLWQMRECGWFSHCAGVIIGRPDGYGDTHDFTLEDALSQSLGDLRVPVLYGADIGHIPPQMQIINGAMGKVEFCGGRATLRQSLK